MTEQDISETRLSLQTLQAELTELAERGFQKSDPVRFCYLESLLQKAQKKPDSVKRVICQRTSGLLSEWQEDFDRQLQAAGQIVQRVAAEFPEEASAINRLFQEKDFNGVQREVARLRSTRCSPLTGLQRYMAGSELTVGKEPVQTVEDRLRQQEADIVNSLIETPVTTVPFSAMPAAGGNDRTELRSVRLFRELIEKRYSENKVRKAVSDGPENPGPLNPEMLIIKTLTAMNDRSPEYVSRIISYAETLQWMDQMAGDTSKDQPNTTTSGRSKNRNRRKK